MHKRDVVKLIMEHLAEELISIEATAKAAHEAATNEESKAEDQYDTRGLEASYLAGAAAKRAEEIRAQLLMYKFLPLRDFGPADVACPSALVELELNGTRAFYFIAPQGGGLIMKIEGRAVQVITPASPMGEALMGRKEGELFDVESRGNTREYKVIAIR